MKENNGIVRRWLLGNEKKINRDSALWNMISSMSYALQSAVLLMVVTRTMGTEYAGMFTITYTLTQMLATIGSFGMRNFQVSDTKDEYSFHNYYTSRILSVFLMVVVCIGYALYLGYGGTKLLTVIVLCMYRVTDDFEDVFHGEIQKQKRLDVASRMMAARIILSSIAFAVTCVITRALLISCVVMTICSTVLFVYMSLCVCDNYKNISLKIQMQNTFMLLFVCTPVCISGFLYNYLVNAPKYAIDRNLDNDTQTIFSILFMPIFAINVLSSFVFKPVIVYMGTYWNNGEKGKFIKTVLKQIVVVVVITAVLDLAGLICGVEVLGIVYGVNLKKYRWLFVLLIAFGGLAALVSYLVVVLTVIRKQFYIIVAYAAGFLFSVICIDRIVSENGIWGAGIAYGVIMGIVLSILTIVLLVSLLFDGKNKEVQDERNQ